MFRYNLIVLLLIFFLPQRCYSQDGKLELYQNGYYIKQYSEIAGLVNGQCKGAFQDSRGFLWISTFQGLSRFDGKHFINYGLKEGLPSLDIYQVCEDSLGLIYVATTKGIARYTGPNSRNDSSFYVYSQMLNLGSPITGMQVIDSANIVFQRTGYGLFLLRNGKLSVLWDKMLRYTRSIFKDKSNNIYAYTMDTMRVYNKNLELVRDIYFPNLGYVSLYYDSNSDIIHAYSNKKVYRLNANGLTSQLPAPDSIVWLCKTASSNAMLYSKKRTDLFLYDGFSSKKILDFSNFPLYSNELLQLKDKTVWMPTNTGGIFRITALPFHERPLPGGGYTRNINNRKMLQADDYLLKDPYVATTYKQFKNTVIKSVFISKSGTVWFCTSNGIYKQDPGKKVEHFLFEGGDKENYGAVANEIRGVEEDDKGDLWFYGYSGIIHYSNGQFKQYTSQHGLGRDILVRNLIIDNTGTVLATDFFNLFKVQEDRVAPLNKELGLPNYIPNKLRKDNNGFVWIDYNKKLFKIEKQRAGNYIVTDSIIPFSRIFFPEVTEFGFDEHNNCWIGYAGGKIEVLFVDKTGHYSHSNSITYTPDDGVNFAVAGDYNFFPDGQGNMTIVPRRSGNEKVFVFGMTDVLERKNLQAPQLNLTGISINYKTPDWTSMGYSVDASGFPVSPRLHHKSNDIRFDYAGILLSNPGDIVYEIMLKGYDNNWRNTTETSVAYTNLPAGTYTFLVKAANPNGLWSKTIEYDFTITLPWYKRWWAITLWVLLLLFAIFLFFFFRVRSIRKTYALNNLKKTNLFNSMLIGLLGHDMMMPLHYMAKVASQLRHNSEKLSKQTTLSTLDEISVTATQLQFLGESIMHWIKMQGDEFIPLKEEFNMTTLVDELILFHVLASTDKKNSIVNELPQQMQCRQDPVLIKIIIHNLLLNANKFTAGGIISIKAEVDGNWLKFCVEDNGQGMSEDRVNSLNRLQPVVSSEGTHKEAGWGMGYILITDLLRLSRGTLHVASELNKGTTVTVKLPLTYMIT